MAMSERRRGDNQASSRRIRRFGAKCFDEIGSEIVQEHTEPRYRNPNRDQARGDWDRSRRHTDENRSRDQGTVGDDGLRPPTE